MFLDTAPCCILRQSCDWLTRRNGNGQRHPGGGLRTAAEDRAEIVELDGLHRPREEPSADNAAVVGRQRDTDTAERRAKGVYGGRSGLRAVGFEQRHVRNQDVLASDEEQPDGKSDELGRSITSSTSRSGRSARSV